jgi:hypothetical protein
MDLRQIILAAPDRKSEAVTIPEWKDPEGTPVTVWVFEMSLKQRMGWMESVPEENDGQYFQRLLVQTVCDEQGKSLFTAEDVEALGQKNPDPIMRLYGVAKKINGIGQAALDDAEKNS